MSRIAPHLLLQSLDGEGVVLVDESAGTEIVVPETSVAALADAAAYFARAVEHGPGWHE